MSCEPSINKPRACANSASPSKACMSPSGLLSAYPEKLKGKVTCFSFNEKATRFIVGTTCGYFVYDINKRALLFSKVFDKAVGIAKILDNTNLVILSGYINRDCLMVPIVDVKVLRLWNDETGSIIKEIGFSYPICDVKIRRERLYVSYRNLITIVATRELKALTTIETSTPPIFDISYQGDFTMVCTDSSGGSVRVWAESLENLRHFKRGQSIKPHKHPITSIAVSQNSSLFATTSDGKNVRLYRMDGTHFNDLHRGVNSAEIRAIAFSPNGSLVAIISSNDTCHIFEKSYSSSYMTLISGSPLYTNFDCKDAKYMAFSSDSSMIIVASDREVKLRSVFLNKANGQLSSSEVGSYNFVTGEVVGSMFVK